MHDQKHTVYDNDFVIDVCIDKLVTQCMIGMIIDQSRYAWCIHSVYVSKQAYASVHLYTCICSISLAHRFVPMCMHIFSCTPKFVNPPLFLVSHSLCVVVCFCWFWGYRFWPVFGHFWPLYRFCGHFGVFRPLSVATSFCGCIRYLSCAASPPPVPTGPRLTPKPLKYVCSH
jgi:hypothetical protein